MSARAAVTGGTLRRPRRERLPRLEADEMSFREAVGDHISEHRSGMLVDLVFACSWVTMVTVLFRVLDGPEWAYYLCMLAGVIAYYGFFASVAIARENETIS